MSHGPLAGVKIVDTTSLISAPLGTMMLADQGAEVIKVEAPGSGDPLRREPFKRGGLSAFFATANRTLTSSDIPASSFEIATTAQSYFLTSGNTRSRRSSSPVTEFRSARPWYAASPASSASTIDESMHSGASVTDCTSLTQSARTGTSRRTR